MRFTLITIALFTFCITNAQELIWKKDSLFVFVDSLAHKKNTNTLNISNNFVKKNKLDEATVYATRFTRAHYERNYKGRNNLGVIKCIQNDTTCYHTFDKLYTSFPDSSIIASNYYYSQILKNGITDNSFRIEGIKELNPLVNGYNLAIINGTLGNYDTAIDETNTLLGKLSELYTQEVLNAIQGNNNLRINDFKKAETHFEKANNDYKHWGLSYIRNNNRQFQEALSLLKSVKIDSSNKAINEGFLYLQLGNPTKAKEKFNFALARPQHNKTIALLGLGASHTFLHETDSATTLLNQLTDSKEAEYVYATLGQLNFLDNDSKTASLYYEKALALNPNNRTLLYNNAVTAFQLAEFEKAKNTLSKCLKHNKTQNSSNELLLMSLINLKLGEKNEALNFIDKITEKQPNHIFANLMKGYILFTKGNYTNAEQSLKIASSSKNKTIKVNALHLLGVIYIKKHQFVEAETVYLGLTAISPTNFKVFSGLAMSQSKLDKFSDAFKNIAISKKLTNNQMDRDYILCNESVILFRKGEVLNNNKDELNADTYLQKAIDTISKAEIKYYNNIGVYYNEQNKKKEAKQFFEKAGDDGGNNNLGVLASLEKKNRKAENYYNQAVRINKEYEIYRANRYINGSFIGTSKSKDYTLAKDWITPQQNKPYAEKFNFVYNWYYFPEFEASQVFGIYSHYPYLMPPYPQLQIPLHLYSDDKIMLAQQLPKVARLGKYKGKCPPHLKTPKRHHRANTELNCELLDSLVTEIIATTPDETKLTSLAQQLTQLTAKANTECGNEFYTDAMTTMKELYYMVEIQEDFIVVLKQLVDKRLLSPTLVNEYIVGYKNSLKNEK